jgi:ABC-type polysaccharide/polyol phosphate transport system, ATPase component
MAGVGKQYPSWDGGFKDRLFPKPHGRWALAPLDLSLPAGRSIAVLGPNGSGKSTLLGIAAGTITPTVGRVARSVDLTLLFVVGTSFDEELSGAENARLELLLRGLTGTTVKAAIQEAREFSGIEEAWEDPLRTYSSGMRARLALATALAAPGRLLLVDEILAVGDAGFVAKCIDHFRKLRNQGCSLMFVSHSVGLAESLGDEAIVLDRGHVVAAGPIEEGLAKYSSLMGIAPRTGS